MREIYAVILSLLVGTTILAQTSANYTINVNENITTTIIFKDDIQSAVVGNNSYSFAFDKNNPSPVGILQGVKGPKSNLTVITHNGNLYNISIVYEKNNTISSHFLSDSLAVGNIKGEVILSAELQQKEEKLIEQRKEELRRSEPIMLNDRSGETTIILDKAVPEESESYINDKQEYMRKFASNLVSKKDFYLRKFSFQNGLYFHLKNFVYNKNELYFVFKIDNESGLDYDVREVEIEMVSKDGSKNTSSQALELKPMMIYNQPSRVEGHKKKTFVYVFDKFSIGDKKSINCTVIEEKGERNITIVLDESTINNPNGS